jgi:cytochrome P450
LVAGDALDLAVDELIRFDSPLQCFERTAAVDTTIGDYSLRAGEPIAALLGAAAHDPAVFPDPSTVDIARSPNPHLGFGAGTHYCLGAPLAKIEAAAALGALTLALPKLELAGEPLRRKEFVIRGWSTVPVTQ